MPQQTHGVAYLCYHCGTYQESQEYIKGKKNLDLIVVKTVPKNNIEKIEEPLLLHQNPKMHFGETVAKYL